MTLKNPPLSRTNEQILERFSSLLVMALPSVEDEPKVVITEIMQNLLPVFLASRDASGNYKDAQNTVA
jgi:hemolysin-activating ACP:hemolysin acyltransferase